MLLHIGLYKMESVHINTTMKGQGSLEFVEELKTEGKNNNLQFLSSLVHTYSTVFMNNLGLDRKIFC